MLNIITWAIGILMAAGTIIGIILEPMVLVGLAAVFMLIMLLDGSFVKKRNRGGDEPPRE